MQHSLLLRLGTGCIHVHIHNHRIHIHIYTYSFTSKYTSPYTHTSIHIYIRPHVQEKVDFKSCCIKISLIKYNTASGDEAHAHLHLHMCVRETCTCMYIHTYKSLKCALVWPWVVHGPFRYNPSRLIRDHLFGVIWVIAYSINKTNSK